MHGSRTDPEEMLALAPQIRARYDERRHLLIDTPGGAVVDAGPQGFAILSRLSEPRSLHELLDAVAADGVLARNEVAAVAVILALRETGALTSVPRSPIPAMGWADPREHGRMLNDTRRTQDFVRAIEATVQPRDVVLEVGTGSGILAVAAARAGARRVYAVEATDIADVAEQVFAVNSVADRVEVIRGWSELVDVAEPADVLVSEVIGSEPLEENLLEMTIDARRRLLKPGARLIPRELTLVAHPLLVPPAEAGRRVFGQADLLRWRHDYDVDLRPLLEASSTDACLDPTEGETVAGWPRVGSSVDLARLPLGAIDQPDVAASTDLDLEDGTVLNAIAITFRAVLHDEILHELDPWRWPASSWTSAVWFLPDPIRVDAGETLRLHYARPPHGTPALTCVVVAGSA